MSIIDPLVLPVPDALSDKAPAAPSGCSSSLWERSRLEWRVGDPGAPAALLSAFLAELGLPTGDLAGLPDRPAGSRCRDGALCGAAVFVSAAASAVMIGADPGPPNPAAAVPDLVVIGYGHDPAPATVPAAVPAAGWRLGPWRPSWTRAQHADAVRGVRAAIARGDVYQVNLVGHASASYRGDPRPALHRVAALPGARYGGVLSGRGWAMACASPETLVRVVDGRVSTGPIKGTRPATAAGHAELLASDKERAEHVMIVDLARNDLSRLALTGSVRVDRLYQVRRWCDLWQAESTVSARLAPGVGLPDLLRALCPGGSVTGAPKLAALAEIATAEPTGRGASMGALGWIAPGRLDLGLTIRTVAVDRQRVHVWAGGGITWGSDPDAEVDEAAAKAGPIRAALGGGPGAGAYSALG
jgi:para-aminobenzoate synthetase component 1